MVDNKAPKTGRGAFRMTRQRRLILEEVRSSRTHPTADELYQQVRRKMPHISLGTVYRNLDVLSESGEILKIEMSEGQRRFDGTLEQHYHVRCTQCGRVGDVWLKPSEDIRNAEAAESDYEIAGHRLEFFGLCPDCRRAGGSQQRA